MRFVVAFVTFVLGLSAYRIFSDAALMDQIGAATTQIVRPLLIPIVELLGAQAFVFISSTLIFVSSIAICGLYVLRHVLPALSELRVLEATIKAIPRPADQVRGLETVLKSVGPVLSLSLALGPAWNAFQLDMRREGQLPARLFSAYAVAEPSRRGHGWDALMRALPGYYVSFGLILTFLGLVVALYVAARGMRLGGTDDARVAIINLLNVASFKFLTSVAAISSAMIVSIVWKTSAMRIQRARRLATAAVDGLIEASRPPSGVTLSGAKLDVIIARLDRIADLLAMSARPPSTPSSDAANPSRP